MDERPIYIGLMSGTSVDAIDAAAMIFPEDEQSKQIEILGTYTHPIPDSIRKEIIALNHKGDNELHRTMTLDMQVGELLAEAALALIDKLKLNKKRIKAIGSHGQTIRHQINTSPHYTVQIGNPHVIAHYTGITTVADFRTRDMVAGGQGAPFAPAFHEALFTSKSVDRVILNIGGMANVTFLWSDDRVMQGFDTGPGNVLMNLWVQKQKGWDYDNNGKWAETGKINEALLHVLLEEPYFLLSPPKSTGRELFDEHWLENKLHAVDEKPENIQATLLALTARSIAQAIESWGPESGEVYVCGGGAHNEALLAALFDALPNFKVQTTSKLGLDPDWVEACAFAWFAKQTLNGKKINLQSVTGASENTIAGSIYPV